MSFLLNQIFILFWSFKTWSLSLTPWLIFCFLFFSFYIHLEFWYLFLETLALLFKGFYWIFHRILIKNEIFFLLDKFLKFRISFPLDIMFLLIEKFILCLKLCNLFLKIFSIERLIFFLFDFFLKIFDNILRN